MTKVSKIELVGEDEQQCIKVDAKDELYITDENIVTHNTIVSGIMSELAFFSDKGFGQDHIFRVMNDLKGRIWSRLEDNYYARSIVDSSPNDLDNIIDKYILEDAPKKEDNLILMGNQWDWQPWKYEKINERFPVFKGSSNKPPQILDQSEKHLYTAQDILMVPNEIRPLFEENTSKALKDYGGIPTGGTDKLLPSQERIEKVFLKGMKNIYLHIEAPADADPTNMIWNIVKEEFFVPTGAPGKFSSIISHRQLDTSILTRQSLGILRGSRSFTLSLLRMEVWSISLT
jgi:hypothetical protein